MNILEKLYECFYNSMKPEKKQLGKHPIMCYLVGEHLEDTFVASSVNALIAGRNWKPEHIRLFLKSNNWGISRLNKKTNFVLNTLIFEKAVKNLYEEYFPPKKVTLSVMVRSLVSLHFFNTVKPETLFVPYTHATLKNNVPWKDMEDRICTALKKSNLVFISGKPASGKSFLIKRVLKKFFPASSDICFMDMPDYTIRKGLQNILFIDGTHDFETVISYLKEKSEQSCLVIKRPFLSTDDYEVIKEHLIPLKLKIIILTQMPPMLQGYPCIPLTERLDEDLKQIYIVSREVDDLTADEFSNFLNIIDRNPCVVSLVGRTLKKEENTEQYYFLKEKFLDRTEWAWDLYPQPTVHGNYHNKKNKSEQTLTRHISYILNSYGNTKLYSSLAVWAKTPVSAQLLVDLSDMSMESIINAVQYGILEYADSNHSTVVMPSIIADAIWNKDAISYEEYKDKLKDFLQAIEIGTPTTIPFQTLYPIIRTMVQRFHFQVYKIADGDDVTDNSDFVEWNHILINLIHKLTEFGDYEIAEEFLPYILYYKQKGQIHDAATKNEQLIRDVIDFKIHFMKNGISDVSISALKNITLKLESFIDFSKTNALNCSTGIQFALQALQCFLDHQIRVDKVYCKDYIISETGELTAHITPNTHLDECLRVFIKLFSKIHSDIPHTEALRLYHYYMIIKALKNNLSGNSTVVSNDVIAEHFNTLIQLGPNSYELFLKANCQHLFYDMIRTLDATPCNLDFTTNTSLIWAENTFNTLATLLIGKIHSFDTLWAFFLCIREFLPYRHLLKHTTQQNIISAWKHMHYLASDQIILPANDKDALLKLISQYTIQIS